jgi:negative regulator of genetic competence, sporulation and motility
MFGYIMNQQSTLLLIMNLRQVISMKFERINENTIRISLSQEEISHRNLSMETIDYHSKEAHAMFLDMLRQAETDFGFASNDTQLCVEIAPDATDGYVITLTRMAPVQTLPTPSKAELRTRSLRKRIAEHRKMPKRICPHLLIQFNEDHDAQSFASRLLNIYTGKATLYKYRNRLYLLLNRNALSAECSLETLASEYGRILHNVHVMQGVLNERGITLSPSNGIRILNDFY